MNPFELQGRWYKSKIPPLTDEDRELLRRWRDESVKRAYEQLRERDRRRRASGVE